MKKIHFIGGALALVLGLSVVGSVHAQVATSTPAIGGHRHAIVVGDSWVIENVPGATAPKVSYTHFPPRDNEERRVDVIWLQEQIRLLSQQLSAMIAAGLR